MVEEDVRNEDLVTCVMLKVARRTLGIGDDGSARRPGKWPRRSLRRRSDHHRC